MTRLAIVRVSDPLHQPAVALRLMTVIAVKFPPVYWRNVGGKVALVIESQHVRIARVLAFQLKLRMRFPEVREGRGVTLGGSR